MNKNKVMKWALPALAMSAMTFELLPGSVGYYAKDVVTAPENTVFNFFTVKAETVAASCLPLAGIVTFALLVLALVAVCFKKTGLYKVVSWGSLAAAALTAMPYILQSEVAFVQPNVVVILLLCGCWLLAQSLTKKGTEDPQKPKQGRRL